MNRLWLLIPLAACSCGCSQSYWDRREASQKAERRKTYVMHNDTEFRNFNRRQEIADDPSTILWCTVDVGGQKLTVPIQGKLTSSHKRPFSVEQNEGVGPDSMYGTSGEYRYGFGPSGVYFEMFENGVCFNQPMKWQTQNTAIVSEVDRAMLEIQNDARSKVAQAAREGRIDPANGKLDPKTQDEIGRLFQEGQRH